MQRNSRHQNVRKKKAAKNCRSKLFIQEEYNEYERVCIVHCKRDVESS